MSAAIPKEDAGWTRRFVVGPQRLPEAVALYESLGYEVRLAPLASTELADECRDCQLATTFFRIIYTRPKRGPT